MAKKQTDTIIAALTEENDALMSDLQRATDAKQAHLATTDALAVELQRYGALLDGVLCLSVAFTRDGTVLCIASPPNIMGDVQQLRAAVQATSVLSSVVQDALFRALDAQRGPGQATAAPREASGEPSQA